jgi:hypothetical protein
MIRKNQRPLYWTDSQLHELRRNNSSLRHLNRAALLELRLIGNTAPTDREYRDAGDTFSGVADQMMSALRVRRELIAAGRERLPDRIELRFGGLCGACRENKLPAKRDDHEEDSRKALELNPEHLQKLEFLLELALRTEARVSVRCESGQDAPKAFFSGIGRLIFAVLRQQRELRETAPKHQPEIAVLMRSSHCRNCHQPLETVDRGRQPNDAMKVAQQAHSN